MADARDTLLLAFEKGLANAPASGEQFLFLNAQMLPPQGRELAAQLPCEQGFRPHFLALKQSGHAVQPLVEGGQFAGAMMLLSRVRQLNEVMLARMWDVVVPGGPIVVCGNNTDGAKSLRKFVARHCGEPESLSKHHAIAFSFHRNGEENPFPPQTKPRRGGYEIAPGMFSADGPDEGSMLLARHFDTRIEGEVGDFGAGWGYLGMELLSAAPNVTRLHSVEADHASLEAARSNVGALAEERDLQFHWLDVVHEPLPSGLDWVVMNPPFHDGRAANPALGTGFIAAASRALRPGGRLLMVANRQLPYEAALEGMFSNHQLLADDGHFKIFEAVKR